MNKISVKNKVLVVPKKDSLAVDSNILIFYSCFENFIKFYRREKCLFLYTKKINKVKERLKGLNIKETDLDGIYVLEIPNTWNKKELKFILELRKIIREK